MIWRDLSNHHIDWYFFVEIYNTGINRKNYFKRIYLGLHSAITPTMTSSDVSVPQSQHSTSSPTSQELSGDSDDSKYSVSNLKIISV